MAFAEFPSVVGEKSIEELLLEYEKPHPTFGKCCAPSCDRSASVGWTKVGELQYQHASIPETEEDRYLCWACCALYALQGVDAASVSFDTLAKTNPILPNVSTTQTNQSLLPITPVQSQHLSVVTQPADHPVFPDSLAYQSHSRNKRAKCPACLTRDGEFKYFGLAVKLCKACYQLWTHHEHYREQHHESMEQHIKNCIKSAESQRRLRVMMNLRCRSGNDTNAVSLPSSQPDDIFVVAVKGSLIKRPFLQMLQTQFQQKHPSVKLVVEATVLSSQDDQSLVLLSVSGALSEVRSAAALIYDSATSTGNQANIHCNTDNKRPVLHDFFSHEDITAAQPTSQQQSSPNFNLKGQLFATGIISLVLWKCDSTNLKLKVDKFMFLGNENVFFGGSLSGKPEDISSCISFLQQHALQLQPQVIFSIV